jgi:hypothetical protein
MSRETRDPEDRWTLPVIERYVRRLIFDNDQQYQSWKRAESARIDADRALSRDTP